MSKRLKLSENQIPEMLKYLEKELRSGKMSDGKFSFTFNVNEELGNRANLIFTPMAYTKMLALVNGFDCEVAWHGYVNRKDANTFEVEDILVYPQKVTGATVNTDQAEYEKWLMTNRVSRIRFQGHSHVNMGVTASSVDMNHQEKIVDQLDDDDYYIFAIWNKKNDYNIFLYDCVENLLYRTDDVDVFVGELPLELKDFMNEADILVKKDSWTTKSKGKDKDKDKDKSTDVSTVWHYGNYGNYYDF